MKTYYVKQKLKLGGEGFSIKDELGQKAYTVKGSFLKIPKTFQVFDDRGELVSQLVKPVLTFLPRFDVSLSSGQTFTIQKKLTFLRDRYQISGLGLVVEGNIWDLNFVLKDQSHRLIARISKKLFHLTSTYEVEVHDLAYKDLVISLVVAIDYVEMLEDRSNNR